MLLNPHDGLCSDEAVARETRLTLDEAQAAPATGGRVVCEASGVVPTWPSHFVCTCVYVRVCVCERERGKQIKTDTMACLEFSCLAQTFQVPFGHCSKMLRDAGTPFFSHCGFVHTVEFVTSVAECRLQTIHAVCVCITLIR